ncbi:MAG: aminotransferase class V-fold PLP-dependent enzyme [SAR202 cluster bacterium]|nr:hypothetical protein [Chloroflexota bacterium]MQG21844.1 aminotransferase class V-fold PLP-dependent enzyme [SAR202 cluster bacterium]|tara:strand:+ start:6525 stop:7691 length:1167 start_codon:yes stop_codon:yes gene_type:complete
MATSNNIYEEIGVQPIINAIGSVTMLGGSTPIPEALEAMAQAGSSYIPLMELEEKAGSAIANMLNVPAAYITSGAGSALTLAAAAVMAGDDDKLIEQLPNTNGMKNEILIQKRQRYWYDRCLETSGATLVDFGTNDKTSPEDLGNAITEKTAAVHFFMVEQELDPNALSLEDTIEIAHNHNIPVLVDAAGQVYPLELMGKAIRMGADFQCVAAKYIGAPQSTGLALGTEKMIRQISKQSFVGYEGRRIRGIGRPHKVDRQEMIGALTAVKYWMQTNHEERLDSIETRSQTIVNLLQNIKGLNATLINNAIGHQPFGVDITIDESIVGMNLQNIVDKLKENDPPIWTRVANKNAYDLNSDPNDHMEIHMFGLNSGEEVIVGEKLADLLG